jgi:ribonuclease P protein component
MLPKKQRLNAAQVRAILKDGTSLRGTAVSAKYLRAASAKVAIVVSKKVAKSAVARNRLRRMGYQALTPPPKHLHLVLFILKAQVTPADIAALCSRLS